MTCKYQTILLIMGVSWGGGGEKCPLAPLKSWIVLNKLEIPLSVEIYITEIYNLSIYNFLHTFRKLY